MQFIKQGLVSCRFTSHWLYRKNMMKIITLACMTFVLEACSVGGLINVSEPSVHANTGPQLDRNGILQLSDLSISIKPSNFKGGLLTAGPMVPIIPLGKGVDARVESGAFEIIVQFEAEDHGFKFEPEKTELSINNQLLVPVSFAGPSNHTIESREHHRSIPGHEWRCGSDFLVYTNTTDAIEIPLSKSCFFLKYEVGTPDPSVEFSVSLFGLKKNGEPVSVPKFIFKEGTRAVYFLLG